MVFTTEVSALTASIPWALTHTRRESCPRTMGNPAELAKMGLKPVYDAEQAHSILRACGDYNRMAAAGKLGQWSKVILQRPQSARADEKDEEGQAIMEKRRLALLADMAILAKALQQEYLL